MMMMRAIQHGIHIVSSFMCFEVKADGWEKMIMIMYVYLHYSVHVHTFVFLFGCEKQI